MSSKVKLGLFISVISLLIVIAIAFFIKHKKQPLTLKEFYITCNAEEFNKLYENYKTDAYIPIVITYNGSTVDAQMRVRGDTSRKDPKKSLKIKFIDKTFADKAKVLNLNAEYADKTYIRQFVSSRLMALAGVTCFKTEHARVYLNGKFLGLYLLIENVDSKFLKSRKIDPKGNLYKAKKDGACLSTFDDIKTKWESKTNKDSTNYSDLKKLIRDINNTSDQNFEQFVKKTFEYKKLISLIAMNMLISNGSTYYHNYYLYHNTNGNGKWEIYPWDLDKTLSFYNWMPYTYNRTSSEWESDNPLIERMILCKPIFNDIKKRLKELSTTVFTEATIFPIIDSLKLILSESVKQDTTDQITTLNSWIKSLDNEKNYIKTHYKKLQAQIKNLPSSFALKNIESTVLSKTLKFRWGSSKSNREKPITYTLYYGKHFLFPDSVTTIVKNIKDTFLIINAPKPGQYYWKMEASDGEFITEGFNSKNIFTVEKGNVLPAEVHNEMILTEDGSPYLLEHNMKVYKNAKLIIKENVQIQIKEGCNIDVSGEISTYGTEKKPIKIIPDANSESWGQIYIMNASSACQFNYTQFNEGLLRSKYSDLTIDHCAFNILKKELNIGDKRMCIIWVHGGKYTLRNSTMNGSGKGEGMDINIADALVENCKLNNTPDAIEYINVNNGIIRNNIIQNSPDDAIDLDGCKNILIYNNSIFNCKDKGISVGTEQYGASTNITISKNLIVGCNVGTAVKDSSTALYVNNTFYNNSIAISCYKKREDYHLGGKATVINSIIAGSKKLNLSADKYSSITIEYSACDTELLPGNNNIKTDPGFVDPKKRNFHLIASSKCKNKSKLDSTLNFDLISKDLGAY